MIRRQIGTEAFLQAIAIDGANYLKAAGTGTYVSSIINTQGYSAVAIITLLGTVTATSVVTQTYQDGNNSNMSDSSNLIAFGTSTGTAGSGTTASQSFTSPTSNSLIVVDIYQPLKQYLTVTTVVATANCAINGMLVLLWSGLQKPVAYTNLAGAIQGLVLNSPADALTV